MTLCASLAGSVNDLRIGEFLEALSEFGPAEGRDGEFDQSADFGLQALGDFFAEFELLLLSSGGKRWIG